MTWRRKWIVNYLYVRQYALNMNDSVADIIAIT